MKIGIDIQNIMIYFRFPDRIFTQGERDYIKSKKDSAQTMTGIWCAKEAYFKAKGGGVTPNNLLTVEVGHYENGAPYYINDQEASLSISHTKGVAVAVCIIS